MVGGLLGVGGGSSSCRRWRSSSDETQLGAEATSLLAIVPVAALGAWRQNRYGNVRLRDGLLVGALSPLGVLAGVALSNAVSERALELSFSALIVLIAVRLVIRGLRTGGGRRSEWMTRCGSRPASRSRSPRSSCGRAARRGPGGQHANVTASRIEAVFDVEASQSLGERDRAGSRARLGPRVTAVAQDARGQARNRELALERLRDKLAAGLREPPQRRPTRPGRAARERRLEDKRRRSQRKRERRRPVRD